MDRNFDQLIPRSGTDCAKWDRYNDGVLPLWVADLDFRSPEPVIQALRERVEHGIFGYPSEPADLRSVIVDRLARLYGWSVAPEALVWMPGVVVGFNLACHAVTKPGDGMLIQTPIYYPMLRVPGNATLTCDEMELTRRPDGSYEIDFDLMERTITPRTRVFMLCNPHNPVGRVYSQGELEGMAEMCLAHDIVICSDEIHCELLLSGARHTPIATLSPEIAQRTITLMAPSKTFNIAGLHCSVAIIENEELRTEFEAAETGLVSSISITGYVAALAAYRDGQPWLDALLQYLEANRDFVADYVNDRLPGITMAKPEGTYLAWLNCREAGIDGSPHDFFLRNARVAVNEGATFGHGGEGYVRLNFGCCRELLEEALFRMEEALVTGQATATPGGDA